MGPAGSARVTGFSGVSSSNCQDVHLGEVLFLPLKWPRVTEYQSASLKLLQKGKKNVNLPSARILQDLSVAFESHDIS